MTDRALSRAGRALIIVGATCIWVPFAALSILAVLLVASSPGFGGGDPALPLFGIVVAVTMPIAVWWSLRTDGARRRVGLAVVSVTIPLAWAALMRPDYSAPLHWITILTAIGAASVVAGVIVTLLRIRKLPRFTRR